MPENEDIWDSVEVDWDGKTAPREASLENAKGLLEKLKILNLLPDVVSRGYWETTIFLWEGKLIDIEVFDVGMELNVYPPLVPGPLFDTYEFDSVSGADWDRLSETLKALLE